MERRKPENASVRRWVNLGDKALGATDESRRRIVARERAEAEREHSKKLRLAAQQTKLKALELLRGRPSVMPKSPS